ncbi:MAG: hypothetical protein ACREJQ_05445 [bacterium]
MDKKTDKTLWGEGLPSYWVQMADEISTSIPQTQLTDHDKREIAVLLWKMNRIAGYVDLLKSTEKGIDRVLREVRGLHAEPVEEIMKKLKDIKRNLQLARKTLPREDQIGL